MPDFNISNIDVRYGTAGWGPHNFDFSDNSLPPGTTISSVVVRSFVGSVDRGAQLSSFVESTSTLIDTAQTEVKDGTSVDVYLNYPGSSLASVSGVVHSLIFELTLDNGAEHPFYFHRVVAYAG